MKQRKCLSTLLAAIIAALALCACHEDTAPAPPDTTGGKMVLVYMVGENSLGAGGYLGKDSAEIMNGRTYVRPDDRMLFFVDGGGKPTLYRARADRPTPETVAQWEQDFCSSDPDRLREVLECAHRLWPGKELSLVLWSHADGWLPPTDTDYQQYAQMRQPIRPGISPSSFGIDSGADGYGSNQGAQMSVEGIASAISGRATAHPGPDLSHPAAPRLGHRATPGRASPATPRRSRQRPRAGSSPGRCRSCR